MHSRKQRGGGWIGEKHSKNQKKRWSREEDNKTIKGAGEPGRGVERWHGGMVAGRAYKGTRARANSKGRANVQGI